MTITIRALPLRWRAFNCHLLCSGAVAACTWMLVTQVWYPWPLATLTGGTQLFLLVIGVDMVLGPSLTAIVANPAKPRRELVRDLGVIVLLQLSALAYGIYALAAARPAVVAFEVDLFRVVSAAEVDTASLSQAPVGYRSLPWTGPMTLAVTKPKDASEILRTVELGLAGIPLAALPAYWRDYAGEQAAAWGRARPIADNALGSSSVRADIERMASQAGVAATQLRTLPLLGRRAEGTILLAPPDARIVGILPVALTP